MLKKYLTLALLFFFSTPFFLSAQTGCPGCQVNLPPGLAADTVYLPPIPDGQVGVYYNNDISFRMPKTTTPVAAIDSVTPPGLTISSIEIISVDGIPPGLNWEPSQTVFPVATQTDGCIKICGTPTQSDSFIVTVRLKASILFFSQEATFPMRIYIAPGSSQNDGFTMSNPTGCGTTAVSFTNNIPSGGNTGYTYTWDFGDSTTYTGETPPPHPYNTPGTYIVDYTAVIDTSPYTLQSVILLDLECVDLLGLGNPDVYLIIKDSSGTVVYSSGNDITDINLPATINVGLPLGPGNYLLEVWDEDSGLKGGDDKCGIVSFNVLSNGNVAAGGFLGILNIEKPTTTFHYTDTVIVYPLPIAPVLEAPKGTVACAEDSPLPLLASYTENIQWYLNGDAISAANDSIYQAVESGFYQVAYTSADGCLSFSDSMEVTINSQPGLPLFSNNGKNFLLMFDTINLPASYNLQWFNNGQAISGANGFWYCAMASGIYTLDITDLASGCNSSYDLNVVYNPAFDCTVGSDDIHLLTTALIYPNPTSDILTIQVPSSVVVEKIDIWNTAGKLSRTIPGNGQYTWQTDCSELPQGIYTLMVHTSTGISPHQVTIIR